MNFDWKPRFPVSRGFLLATRSYLLDKNKRKSWKNGIFLSSSLYTMFFSRARGKNKRKGARGAQSFGRLLVDIIRDEFDVSVPHDNVIAVTDPGSNRIGDLFRADGSSSLDDVVSIAPASVPVGILFIEHLVDSMHWGVLISLDEEQIRFGLQMIEQIESGTKDESCDRHSCSPFRLRVCILPLNSLHF
jgi:hypothetical protein